MVKPFPISLILMLLTFQINCQENIYTPKGHLVVAYYIPDEYPDSLREVFDNAYSLEYPNADLIITYGGYSTTKKFNCHGYAWHVSEGGDYVWIGAGPSGNQEAIYWQDYSEPSYIQIPSAHFPGGKVSYGYNNSHDHSAVVANPLIHGDGWVVSKWGDKVLMRHAYGDNPSWDADSLKFYKLNPKMTGSTNILCNNVQRTYVSDITHMSDATFNWTKGPYLSAVSGGGTHDSQYTVKGSGNGSTYVNLAITTPSGFSWSSNKTFWAGKPLITNQKVDGGTYYSGMQICPGNHWLSVTPIGGNPSTATWTVPPGIPYYVGTNTLDFTFPSSFSSVSISVRSANSCGTGPNAYFYLTKKNYGCSLSTGMNIFPNPASNEITITMDELSLMVDANDSSIVLIDHVNDENKELTEYTIRIYDHQGTLYITETRTGKSFTISLSNLKNGNYVVEVSDDKNIYREQLIVKHE